LWSYLKNRCKALWTPNFFLTYFWVSSMDASTYLSTSFCLLAQIVTRQVRHHLSMPTSKMSKETGNVDLSCPIGIVLIKENDCNVGQGNLYNCQLINSCHSAEKMSSSYWCLRFASLLTSPAGVRWWPSSTKLGHINSKWCRHFDGRWFGSRHFDSRWFGSRHFYAASQIRTFLSPPPVFSHRNPSTRTRMFELLLQTFWAKKTCKKAAELHPRQGNLLHWNIFTRLNKTSLHFTK
jgi:hypothetical protein